MYLENFSMVFENISSISMRIKFCVFENLYYLIEWKICIIFTNDLCFKWKLIKFKIIYQWNEMKNWVVEDIYYLNKKKNLIYSEKYLL